MRLEGLPKQSTGYFGTLKRDNVARMKNEKKELRGKVIKI